MFYRASANFSVRDLSDLDLMIYERVLPAKSLLLSALEEIDWADIERQLEEFYPKSGRGREPYPPLILLKMEFLKSLYAVSQRECVERCMYDLHWKYFLGLPLDAQTIDQSGMSYFRRRLGPDGFRKVFDALIAQARRCGLVGDRLRLKDATHIIGDVAVPSTLKLFAQLRERILAVIDEWDRQAADDFRLQADTVHFEGEGSDNASKLAARVALTKDMLEWLQQRASREHESAPAAAEGSQATEPHAQAASATASPQEAKKSQAAAAARSQRLADIIQLTKKVLGDQETPGGGDRTISLVDPDVRCGKHGEFYDGYLLDIMMDADSELITALDVLPANGQEAADALHLIEQEEQAHGNDIQMLSMDSIGFNGEVAERLECKEDGPQVTLFTPPYAFNENEGYGSERFELNESGDRVRCPAGKLSSTAQGVACNANRRRYTFAASACRGCPLRPECDPKHVGNDRRGKNVYRNNFEGTYQRLRERAKSEQYRQVRSEHGAVERKLNEIVRHHAGRRARYRGIERVFMQQAMISFAINIKRMVCLLAGRRNRKVAAASIIAAAA